VLAQFDQQHGRSDSGAILLAACDARLGLTERLIGGIAERRQAGKIRHALGDLLRQRLYAIACDYPDGNDASRLASDPIHKLLCDRDPVRGEDLASQPRLSRFENALGRADLYRMGLALAETVIERHRRRLKRKVRRITIDLDPTDDPTHGTQQLAFFNGHYDSWCYLPVAGFRSFNDESEQYLFAYVLRPGNVTASVGAIGILSRLPPRLRAAFPRESGATAHVYGESHYAAATWSERRRVLIKAEVVRHPGRDPKNNPRFVVTNRNASPRHQYPARTTPEARRRTRVALSDCARTHPSANSLSRGGRPWPKSRDNTRAPSKIIAAHQHQASTSAGRTP
jgi:hypothetical protein